MVWQPVPQHAGVAHSHPSTSGAVPLLQSEEPALQVYEQLDPLQLAAEALVRLHLLPQALQLLVVLSSVHVVPPHSVSRHLQVPFWQSGDGWAQVVPFTQLPVPPHVCVVLPLQLVWPGPQTPVHDPLTQVWFEQVVPLTQAPPLHDCVVLPLHCVWPGAQEPTQKPPLQVWLVQAAGAPQVPLASQVWTPLPEHCLAPGVHDPLHTPGATHAELVQAAAVPQFPVALQVWTPLPWHCVCRGAQTPLQTPLTQVWLEQATGAPQLPVPLHVWTPLFEH